ncbi:MAG: HAMP domain-containing protein, partial [Candidatus Riflebacteria bacterium]|nr:HAMP domain-containing protein [Candidatus Riflebacteria bacterium]
MINLEKITINFKLKSQPVLMFIIWLFLIILPFIILTESIDAVLKESEKNLLSKSKIKLLDEVDKFRGNLTHSFYLESKLAIFPNNNCESYKNALFLAQAMERHTSSKVAALFYYDSVNNTFDAYVDNGLKKDFGLYSNYTMKNLLLTYAGKTKSSEIKNRSIAYFQTFLLAAGGINFKPETAIPILSGKNNLGKMHGYFKTFGSGDSKNQMFLCLFREKDIPLKEIIKNAQNLRSNDNFKRQIVSFDKLSDSVSNIGELNGNNGNLFYKFQRNEKDGLSIIAASSDEMLLRLGTLNTFYPLNFEGLLKREPVLKVSLANSQLEHPMRDLVKKLRFPTLLLILLISFGLTKIGIFGYLTNVHILGKVILCVLGAVVLPFTSFIAASYYNQYFIEEYAENEIEHYLQIQTEVINKAVEAYIGEKELSITELRERLTGLTQEEFHKVLTEWCFDNDASFISYNYLDREDKTIESKKYKKNAFLSQLGKEAKDIFDISFSNAFIEYDLSKVNQEKDLERVYGKMNPNQISVVVTNIGKIYISVPNEPNCLYSVFPIYNKIFDGKKEKITVIGSVLIKFNTDTILSIIKKYRSSVLFKDKIMGKYIVKNALIPITDEGLISREEKLFYNGAALENAEKKINQIIANRSKITWNDGDSINIGTYLNQVNSVIISKAEKVNNSSDLLSKIDMKSLMIYIILMVAALSVMLGSIIVSPIRELQKASEKVANGDYSYKIEAKTGDEFESLSEAFNEMTDALLQKEKMTSYVSKDVIEEVSNNNENLLQPSGERVPVSVLFCALSGEKELSSYSPEEVTKIISCLIDAVDEISSAFNGQVDKLIEDTVMIVFRKSHPNENIALNACRAALAINSRLKVELHDFKL